MEETQEINRNGALLQAPASPICTSIPAVWAGMKPTRLVLSATFGAKRLTIPAAALMVLWQLGEALVPVLMGLAIERAIADGEIRDLMIWIAVLAATYLVFTMSARFGFRLTALGQQAVQHRLRDLITARLLDPGGLHGAAQRPGAALAVASSDTSRLLNAVGLGVHPLSQLAGIVFGGSVILYISWPLGLALLIGTPLLVLLIDRTGATLRRRSADEQATAAEAAGRAADFTAGYRVIAGLRAEKEAARRYRNTSQTALHSALKARTSQGILVAVSTGTSGLLLAAVTIVAAWQALQGTINIGELVMVVGLTQFLIDPLTSFATSISTSWATAQASSQRLLDVSNASPLHTTRPTASLLIDSSRRPEELVFDSVVLGGGRLSASIRPGECVGIAVHGGDAADIQSALTSRRPPRGGELRYGDSSGPPPASVMLVAPHNAALFDGSVLENVTLGNVSRERAATALEEVGCTEFLGALPDGVETQVGEGGRQLSGGQRQRVALARALAQDAPVLVLHEPTTAVDSVTEHDIASLLRTARAGRTTLLITQSSTLLAAVDRQLEIVCEKGAPDER